MKKRIITPKDSSFWEKLTELVEYRELLWVLAWRTFKVKYAQTLLGFAWGIINPVFTLIVLSFVFGVVAKVDTSGIPHPLYTLAGLCGWTFFASLSADAGKSVLSAQNMVKKIYFPRMILPLSNILNSLVDFIIVLGCLFILMIFYQYPPSVNLIWFPFFVFWVIIAGVASGIWVVALTIRFRDFHHVMPLVMRLGMYVTPIAYPASSVPDKFKLLFYLNPLAGIVEGIRWSILGTDIFPSYIWISLGVLSFMFISGWAFFNKVERIIADII